MCLSFFSYFWIFRIFQETPFAGAARIHVSSMPYQKCRQCQQWNIYTYDGLILDGVQIDQHFICDACNQKYFFRKKWCNNQKCHIWTLFRNDFCFFCERKYKKGLATELAQVIPQVLPEVRNIIVQYSGEHRLQLWQISQ